MIEAEPRHACKTLASERHARRNEVRVEPGLHARAQDLFEILTHARLSPR